MQINKLLLFDRFDTVSMDFYITGFGKFGDIIDNPSAKIAQDIANDVNVTEVEVMEVSMEGIELPEHEDSLLQYNNALGSIQTLHAMQHRALVGENIRRLENLTFYDPLGAETALHFHSFRRTCGSNSYST